MHINHYEVIALRYWNISRNEKKKLEWHFVVLNVHTKLTVIHTKN